MPKKMAKAVAVPSSPVNAKPSAMDTFDFQDSPAPASRALVGKSKVPQKSIPAGSSPTGKKSSSAANSKVAQPAAKKARKIIDDDEDEDDVYAAINTVAKVAVASEAAAKKSKRHDEEEADDISSESESDGSSEASDSDDSDDGFVRPAPTKAKAASTKAPKAPKARKAKEGGEKSKRGTAVDGVCKTLQSHEHGLSSTAPPVLFYSSSVLRSIALGPEGKGKGKAGITMAGLDLVGQDAEDRRAFVYEQAQMALEAARAQAALASARARAEAARPRAVKAGEAAVGIVEESLRAKAAKVEEGRKAMLSNDLNALVTFSDEHRALDKLTKTTHASIKAGLYSALPLWDLDRNGPPDGYMAAQEEALDTDRKLAAEAARIIAVKEKLDAESLEEARAKGVANPVSFTDIVGQLPDSEDEDGAGASGFNTRLAKKLSTKEGRQEVLEARLKRAAHKVIPTAQAAARMLQGSVKATVEDKTVTLGSFLACVDKAARLQADLGNGQGNLAGVVEVTTEHQDKAGKTTSEQDKEEGAGASSSSSASPGRGSSSSLPPSPSKAEVRATAGGAATSDDALYGSLCALGYPTLDSTTGSADEDEEMEGQSEVPESLKAAARDLAQALAKYIAVEPAGSDGPGASPHPSHMTKGSEERPGDSTLLTPAGWYVLTEYLTSKGLSYPEYEALPRADKSKASQAALAALSDEKAQSYRTLATTALGRRIAACSEAKRAVLDKLRTLAREVVAAQEAAKAVKSTSQAETQAEDEVVEQEEEAPAKADEDKDKPKERFTLRDAARAKYSVTLPAPDRAMVQLVHAMEKLQDLNAKRANVDKASDKERLEAVMKDIIINMKASWVWRTVQAELVALLPPRQAKKSNSKGKAKGKAKDEDEDEMEVDEPLVASTFDPAESDEALTSNPAWKLLAFAAEHAPVEWESEGDADAFDAEMARPERQEDKDVRAALKYAQAFLSLFKGFTPVFRMGVYNTVAGQVSITGHTTAVTLEFSPSSTVAHTGITPSVMRSIQDILAGKGKAGAGASSSSASSSAAASSSKVSPTRVVTSVDLSTGQKALDLLKTKARATITSDEHPSGLPAGNVHTGAPAGSSPASSSKSSPAIPSPELTDLLLHALPGELSVAFKYSVSTEYSSGFQAMLDGRPPYEASWSMVAAKDGVFIADLPESTAVPVEYRPSYVKGRRAGKRKQREDEEGQQEGKGAEADEEAQAQAQAAAAAKAKRARPTKAQDEDDEDDEEEQIVVPTLFSRGQGRTKNVVREAYKVTSAPSPVLRKVVAMAKARAEAEEAAATSAIATEARARVDAVAAQIESKVASKKGKASPAKSSSPVAEDTDLGEEQTASAAQATTQVAASQPAASPAKAKKAVPKRGAAAKPTVRRAAAAVEATQPAATRAKPTAEPTQAQATPAKAKKARRA